MYYAAVRCFAIVVITMGNFAVCQLSGAVSNSTASPGRIIKLFPGQQLSLPFFPNAKLPNGMLQGIKIGNRTIPVDFSKINGSLTLRIPEDIDISADNTVRLPGLLGSNASIVSSIYKNSRYIPSLALNELNGKILIPQLDARRLPSDYTLTINGIKVRTIVDNGAVYAIVPEELNKFGVQYTIKDDNTGVYLGTSRKSNTNTSNILIASTEMISDKQSLASRFEISEGDDDYKILSFMPQGRLQGLFNGMPGRICGKYLYRLGNVTNDIKNIINSNVMIDGKDDLLPNPLGGLWPTGDSSKSIKFQEMDKNKYNQNYIDKYIGLMPIKFRYKQAVHVHILDTGSEMSDTYVDSITNQRGHGAVIQSIINHVLSGTKNDSIKMTPVPVCGPSCDVISVVEQLCRIRQLSLVDKNTRNSNVRVVNLSMGSIESQPILTQAIHDNLQVGVSVVLSYGNKTTCQYQQKKIFGEASDTCYQYPADDWNSQAAVLSSSGRPTSLQAGLQWNGLYIVRSEFDGKLDDRINRLLPPTSLAAINVLATPSAYYYKESARAGTSYSTAYFSAALAIWRSCSKEQSIGPLNGGKDAFTSNDMMSLFLLKKYCEDQK